jgi:hypothetical protein
MRRITLRASGARAPDDMKSGEYIVRCQHGEVKTKGDKIVAELTYSVLGKYTDRGFEKKHEGVVLKQWYSLGKVEDDEDDIKIDVSPHSKYGVAWSLPKGRPLRSNEIPNPKVFENKIFRVEVGFRSNAGGTFSYKNLTKKKDAKDFLRVHETLEMIEEKALTHMTPYDPNNNVNVHLHGHEHDTRASAPAPALAEKHRHSSIRMVGEFHRDNEQAHQGHATEEMGQLTQDSPLPSDLEMRRLTPENLAEDWEEVAILRPKSPETLKKIAMVKSIFGGGRVVK